MLSFSRFVFFFLITWVVNGVRACVQYPKDGLCSDYINYNVYIGEADSIQNIESRLATLKPLLSVISPVPQTCAGAYAEWICGLAYPQCNNTNIITPPCKSTCQKVLNNCTSSAFQDPMIKSIYPSSDYYPLPTNDTCNESINSFNFGQSFHLPITPIYNNAYPDNQCNDIQKIDSQPKCFPPLIVDPQYLLDGSFTNSTYCAFGCCLPCPQTYTLYPSGTLSQSFLATQIIRVFSTLTSFITLLSYVILPGKRSNASFLIMYTSLAIFLYSSNVFFSLGQPKRIQCADSIHQSTQQNNPLCAVQGASLLFAAHATTTWLAAIILNLHTHTVWNSNIMFTKHLYIHLVCWGVPAIITITTIFLNSIDYQFGSLCFVTIKHVEYLFFYPMAVWIIPSVIIHLATLIHIARIATQTEIKSSSTDGTDHRTHVLRAFRIQWRALLLAVILLLTVLLYWLFYVRVLSQISDVTQMDESLAEWMRCIGLGFGQDFCSRYSNTEVPYLPLLVSADALVSFLGIWLLIIFTNRSLWGEWTHWFSTQFKRKRKSLEVPDQFFSM